MAKSIVISVPHELDQQEARRRIALEIEQLKSVYLDKLAHCDVTWIGDVATIRVVALAQEATAHIDVGAQHVRIEIILPWLLARLGTKIESLLTATTQDRLAITHSSARK